MSSKRAFITGITGQDGAALATLLLEKNYHVTGIRPYLPVDDTERLTDIIKDIDLVYGDLADTGSLMRTLASVKPDEIYNLAGLSHVQASFDMPEVTTDINAIGPLRLLEAMRGIGLTKARFYQASSSEMYGNVPAPQDENTPFMPCSPYAIAKLSAYWSVRLYRRAYGFHASNGILFNHESAQRGGDFVTRKITRAVGEFAAGRIVPLMLGNLDAMRDWGHARDYMEGAYLMLQQPQGDDYVLASGEARTVRDFAARAFACAGRTVAWQGTGMLETGLDKNTGQVLIKIDPAFYRPLEIDVLCGNADKARRILEWQPRISFDQMVGEMVAADMPALRENRRYG